MFGGFDHLSNAAEAKSRKKREQKQQAQSAADDDGNETGENQDAHSVQESRIKKLASLRLAEAAKIAAEMEVENFEASQLIVPDIPPDLIQDTLAQLIAGHDSKEGRKENPISVEDYMAFFKVAHKKLRSPEARAVLRHLSMTEDSISVISQALINMQRSCFSDCDINVDHGCQNLGEVEFQYVGNFELLERRDAFLEMCRQCFLTAVNDAMKLRQRQAQDKGGVFELQRTGTLSKQQIMLFIETCTVTFQTDETRKRLRAAYEEGEASGKENGGETAASNACLILQYENMEKVGFDKVFGVQQLNGVVNTSMNDQQMMMKMSNFAQLCQEIVSTASISRVQFYMDQQRMIDAKVKQIEEEVADAETANLQTEGIMTRDQFMSFFNKNFELFELEETKTKLRNIARTSEGIADLNRVMVEMQKSQFAEVGVSRKVGNDSLGVLQSEFGDDQELMTLIKKFERKCSSVWIQAVKTAKTKKLQKNGRLSRLNLVNFLDGIKALLTTEESRTALRETYLSANREAAAQLSVKMQRDMLETLGIEANFGVANLNKIGQDYSGDREVMQKMMMFQRVAQQAVVLSTMSDEQIAAAEAEEKAKQEKARQQQQAMQERGRQVQLAVSSMSQEEKDKVKEKMNAKWTTLMRLPQQDKMTYMSRLPDHDQIDFAMMSAIMMQEKMEVAALASAGRTAAGAGGGGRRDVAVTPTDKNN